MRKAQLTTVELNQHKAMHLKDFDDTVKKIAILEENLAPLLTAWQKHWLKTTRDEIILSNTLAGIQTRVHNVAQLFAHVIIQHSIRGYTYRHLSEHLDITPQRVRQICLKEIKRRSDAEQKRSRGVIVRRPWDAP